VLRRDKGSSTSDPGESAVAIRDYFVSEDFETRFHSIKRAALGGDARLRMPRGELEWCLFPLGGRIGLENGRSRLDIEERSLVLCPPGEDFSIVNAASHRVDVLLAGVRATGRAEASGVTAGFRSARLDRSLLSPLAAHLGHGEIEFRTIFDRQCSSWGSIDHVLVPPATSVGYHRNHNVEEVFVILTGKGRMRIEDEVVDVSVGDCIANPLGGAHGIVNPTEGSLEFLNFGVATGDEPADVTDLGDDLGSLVGGQMARPDAP
jgi:mannose-6-phosphate isomerase-like protein (cupin superfamily)